MNLYTCACGVVAPFGTCDGAAPGADDEEADLHESLRVYARSSLGAPEDPWANRTVVVRPIGADSFGQTFRYVLERSGWPVLKCGNGKGLKRCLMLDGDDNFTWGSKKSGNMPTSVPLRDIKLVTRSAFNDGPAGADVKCMLIFNINDTHGLKILAQSEADAIVIAHGFALIGGGGSGGFSSSYYKERPPTIVSLPSLPSSQ